MRGTPRLLSVVWIWSTLIALVAALFGLPDAHSAFALTTTPSMPVIVNSAAIVVNTGGDHIRIRNGPGTNFDRVAYASEGQTVNVFDGPSNDASGNRWFEVQAPAGTGWMSAAFLQGTGAPLTGTAIVANTGADPLRVRSDPDTNGQILTLLDPGTTVTINTGPVTDDTGIAWYSITARSVTGWSMAEYLSQTPSQQNTPPTQAQPAAPAPTAAPAPVSAPVSAPASTPTPAPAQSGARTTLQQYRLWMEDARTQYPYRESVDKMWSVMMCESGGNANALGGGYYHGLFQYAPPTWAGSWNPYRSNSIWDARSQIYATAKAWSIGMQHAWSCY